MLYITLHIFCIYIYTYIHIYNIYLSVYLSIYLSIYSYIYIYIPVYIYIHTQLLNYYIERVLNPETKVFESQSRIKQIERSNE